MKSFVDLFYPNFNNLLFSFKFLHHLPYHHVVIIFIETNLKLNHFITIKLFTIIH